MENEGLVHFCFKGLIRGIAFYKIFKNSYKWSAIKEKWTLLVVLTLVEQNILPFVYHTSSISKLHPVVQQILLANSSFVQRRIPNSEHSVLAFENVSVEQSGVLLLHDLLSKLQHLTGPV